MKVSFTGLGDVGRVVARFAGMPAEKVPDQIHISGDSASISQTADVMSTAGAGH